ncbi:hypothetical protein [Reichenbachiella versicolor]|uniref:hypothetical protein n=1 Tax=Reichenbachiella versicolor TaxID=1821036 RepID=UPI000D6E4F42|nr:hypothetical protein [Reichenbachiella versicolor]
MNQYGLLLLFLSVIVGCQPSYDQTKNSDPDLIKLEKLFENKYQLIGNKVTKKGILGGENETTILTIDSAIVDNELTLLNGNELAKTFLNGGYDKIVEGGATIFKRKETEKQGPIFLKIKYDGAASVSISTLEDKSNVLYESQTLRKYKFENQRLYSYEISGKQNIIGQEKSEYSVIGKISH